MYLQLVAEETDHQSDSSDEDTIDYRELETQGQMRLPLRLNDEPPTRFRSQ